MSDIESFIRSQKEKLSREKSGSNQGYYQETFNQRGPNIDYNRQLQEYMNLPGNNRAPNPQSENIPLKNQNNEQERYQAQQYQAQQYQVQQQQVQQQQVQQQQNNGKEKKEDFYNNFGKKYDAHKDKLKNDLTQEYKDYLKKNGNKTNRKGAPTVSDKYYATLPLTGMKSAAKNNANTDENKVFSISKNFGNKRWDRWTKNKKEPDIKPYSQPQGNSETYEYQNQNPSIPENPKIDPRSYSYDQIPNKAPNIPNNYRPISQNSLENYNQPIQQQQMPNEAWRSPAPPVNYNQMYTPPAVDPSLSAILSRPPVGYKPVHVPQQNDHYQQNRVLDYQNGYNKFEDQNQNYSNQNAPSYNAPPQQNYQQFTQNSQPVKASVKDEGIFNFTDNNSNLNAKAQKAKDYQNELNKQIREKQMQKQREKDAENQLDEKRRQENLSYDPYGKSGGGAPIKDNSGNIVANLDRVKADPSQFSPRDLPNPYQQGGQYAQQQQAPQYAQPPSHVPNPNNVSTDFNSGFSTERRNENDKVFARGGNGLFGEAKSESQKKNENKYKDELQQQIDEKRRRKEEEKEKQRLEDEKEYNRIMAQQARIKQELEEEERKKKEKEEKGREINKEEGKRVANKKNTVEAPKNTPSKFQAFRNEMKSKKAAEENNPPFQSQSQPQPQAQPEFRSNSPPVPAIGKKLNANEKAAINKPANNNVASETTADYYVTESKLNVSSPPITPSATEYPINKKPNNVKEFPKKMNNSNKNLNSNSRHSLCREASQISNNEVLTQLKNLKKHLHKEQMQVENDLNNSKNRTNIGQLSDIRHRILNVETPTGDKDVFYSALNREPALIRRDPSDFQKTYRKELETPPLHGGHEQGTYFREHTVVLEKQKKIQNENLFDVNALEEQATRRQINKINTLNLADDDLNLNYDTQLLSARNQQRLRKLRDLEDDNLSNADPNEVLDKFLNKNNRHPSARTLNDDTWLRQDA